MANKTPPTGATPLEPTDRVLYVEIEPGVYALAVASAGITGLGTTRDITVSPMDDISGAPVTIDEVHHNVHTGVSFTASYIDQAIANADGIGLLIRTGSRYTHLTWSASCGGDARLRFIDVTVTAAGTQILARNLKRTDSDNAVATVYHSSTVVLGDVLLDSILPDGIGGNVSGDVMRQGTEFILRRNHDYWLELTNISGGAQPGGLVLEWYEETEN